MERWVIAAGEPVQNPISARAARPGTLPEPVRQRGRLLYFSHKWAAPHSQHHKTLAPHLAGVNRHWKLVVVYVISLVGRQCRKDEFRKDRRTRE